MKSRLLIWILAVAIFGMSNGFIVMFKKNNVPEQNIYFDVRTYQNKNYINQNLADNTFKKITIKPVNTLNPDADFIISEHFDNSEKSDFSTVYESFYTSPIVMFANNEVVKKDSIFSIVNPSEENSNKKLEVDLRIILNAMLEGKTWNDLGTHARIAGGDVSFTIPSKNNPYYPYVEAMIYYALNDYNELTEDNVILLTPKVNIILDKCRSVDDIVSFMEKNSKEIVSLNSVVMAPEYLIVRDRDKFNTVNSTHWRPVYFNKSIGLSYDLVFKDSVNEETRNKIFNFLSDTKSFKTLGFRPVEPNFKFKDVSGFKTIISPIDLFPINISNFENWRNNL